VLYPLLSSLYVVFVCMQLYRNMAGSCGRRQLIIWKDKRNGTRLLEVFVTIIIGKMQGPNYKKILRLSYDVIITYDNRKSNLR